ncbi:helix-turn-helix domain-containing protein, partial [Amycolatopsis vastitatis]|uniref:helix-turn-helix domain-containing protein n=1 Tax=Amycolatopsis vastitatis TaxID=1905142 RepID=UPI00196B75FA
MFEIREDRSPQGPRKLGDERQAYLDLVTRGVGTAEACRIVGINRRTGHRWRNGRASQTRAGRETDQQSSARPSPSVGRFLSVEERIVIADLRRAGRSVRAIAAELGRSASTISRELTRNSHPGSGDYRPHAAQARAESRRPRPKTGKIAACPELHALVQGMLEDKFSPEQISRRLRRDHPDRPELHVTHETIYQALYVQGRGELRRELATALRTGRTMRKPRRSSEQRRP